MTDTNLSLVLDELDNAKRKHPKFVDHFFRNCALADGYGDCGCKPKRHEGVWECDCWEPLPPDKEDDDTERRR